MATPLHVHLLRSNQHDVSSIREALSSLHLDELWLRLVPLSETAWDGAELLMLELYSLAEGLPVMPETLGVVLSSGDKHALRLSTDATRTSFAYELSVNGASKASWAGTIAEKDEDVPPSRLQPDPERQAALARHFTQDTGLDLEAILASDALHEDSAEVAKDGAQVMLRGRFLALPPGMGRWPELFRFHDRNIPAELDDVKDGDHVALVGLDLKATESLWRHTPANQVLQFLRLMDPLKGKVLGPLGDQLPQALAYAEAAAPQAPLSAAATPDLATYEVLALSTALVFMVGDRIHYIDQRFFPLLALEGDTVSRDAIEDSAEDIAALGVLSAMTEVLPYSVPEGEMLEAVADEELAPLASWAAKGGVYEGSLLLLDPRRLAEQVERFDLDRLRTRARAFQEAWFPVDAPTTADIGEWITERQELDAADLARFEDTFVELQHLLALCALNNLQPAVLFYGD